MNKIFTGVLLVNLTNLFITINFITINTFRIDTYFVGYFIMCWGLMEVSSLSNRFKGILVLAGAMILFHVSSSAVFLLGIILPRYLHLALNLLLMAFTLLIPYNIIKGVEDIEAEHKIDLHSRQLYLAWKLLVGLSILQSVLTFFQFPLSVVLLMIPLLIIVAIGQFIITIYYLYRFNKMRVLFNKFDEELLETLPKKRPDDSPHDAGEITGAGLRHGLYPYRNIRAKDHRWFQQRRKDRRTSRRKGSEATRPLNRRKRRIRRKPHERMQRRGCRF